MKPISSPTAGTANWPARSAIDAHHAPPYGSEATRKANASSAASAIIASTHMSAQDTAPAARRHQTTATPACAATIERDERAHRGGVPLVRRQVAERGGSNGGPGEEEGT